MKEQRQINAFVPQLQYQRNEEKQIYSFFLLNYWRNKDLSKYKKTKNTNLFIPKLSKEGRQTKVFVPKPSMERKKTNALVPQL